MPAAVGSASKGTHALFGSLSVYSSIIAIITGILSLAGRGDNANLKDLLYKTMAVVALALAAALSVLFASPRPSLVNSSSSASEAS